MRRSIIILIIIMVFFLGQTEGNTNNIEVEPTFIKQETKEMETELEKELEEVEIIKTDFSLFQSLELNSKSFTISEVGKGNVFKTHKQKILPASTVKLATVLYIVNNYEFNEITISERASNQVRSNCGYYFKNGEVVTRNEALHALLICSSNDIAYALAENLEGSEERFLVKMNDWLTWKLWIFDTHFGTVSGLHSKQTYTTMGDMLEIATKFQQNDYLMEVLNTQKIQLSNGSELTNKRYNETNLGMKTGFTNESGSNLIAFHEVAGSKFIILLYEVNGVQNLLQDLQKIIKKLEKEERK